MSRPIAKESISQAAGTVDGEPFATKGHNSLGLFVLARNLDTANDTLEVELQASFAGDEWAGVVSAGGDKPKLVEGDFKDPDGDGNYAAFLYAHGVPAPEVRASIISLTDSANGDLEVDAYVHATGNAGGNGHRYEL